MESVRRGRIGSGRVRRWAIVVALIAVLAALPYAVGQLPASASSVTAASLLSKVQASATVGYSGYAEAVGSLALPVTTGQFSSAADLLGSTTQVRVWWRGPHDWRVDDLSATGEQDLHAVGDDQWTWNYESNVAEFDRGTATVSARLPRPDDLVPSTLARRLLSQAGPAEVARIAGQRVAGRDAAGLRYRPAQPQSTVDHVDVWALPGSGLPLKVAVYAKGDPTAVVSSALLDVSTDVPAPAVTAFVPAAGVKVEVQRAPDILSLANRIQAQLTPDELGGLTRDPISPAGSSVVVYGSGVTVLVAIPVFGRTGDQLRDQLSKAVGHTSGASGIAESIGVVNLLLSNPVSTAVITGRNVTLPISWLLVGTVTPAVLEQAGTELMATSR